MHYLTKLGCLIASGAEEVENANFKKYGIPINQIIRLNDVLNKENQKNI